MCWSLCGQVGRSTQDSYVVREIFARNVGYTLSNNLKISDLVAQFFPSLLAPRFPPKAENRRRLDLYKSIEGMPPTPPHQKKNINAFYLNNLFFFCYHNISSLRSNFPGPCGRGSRPLLPNRSTLSCLLVVCWVLLLRLLRLWRRGGDHWAERHILWLPLSWSFVHF